MRVYGTSLALGTFLLCIAPQWPQARPSAQQIDSNHLTTDPLPVVVPFAPRTGESVAGLPVEYNSPQTTSRGSFPNGG